LTGGLWDVYPLLETEVVFPGGRGRLVQVFTGRAAVLVHIERPKKRRKKDEGEPESDRLVFCDPADIRPAAVLA